LNPNSTAIPLTLFTLNYWKKIAVLVTAGVLSVMSSIASNDNPKKALLSEQQKSVITYFKEVALGFEFGNTTAVTRKWTNNMNIYIAGKPSAEAKAELKKIAAEINALANDGFKINIVSRREDSNMYLFFGSKSEYAELFPKEAPLLKGASGLCTISWNNKNHIIKGHIFIKNQNISAVEQRHVIREEVTQALGLGKDSPRYMDSVFQSAYTTPTEYASIDKQLISLLYNPKMDAGLLSSDVENVLAGILVTGL
jgi:hypothetical protein